MTKERQRQLLHDRGICVVIPTYNNEGTIVSVVRETLEECSDVIVVNDGSTDSTSSILQSTEGITIVEYDENRGKGYALKCGFRRALEMGFSYAITLDSDGQHYPSDIERFLSANREHPGALIVGSRVMDNVERGSGSSFANKFSNFWFYIETGRRLPDTQSGYRLYPLKKLSGLGLLTSRYEAELELLVFASWHGVELVAIDIRVYYPPRGERVSHFRPVKDFARISVLNTFLCFLAIVYGLPLRLLRWLGNGVRTLYSILFVLFFCLCVMTPAVWMYVKMGRMTERKRQNLHKLIYHACRFVMLKHGIPGTRFTYQQNTGVKFSDYESECGKISLSDHKSESSVAITKPAVIICNHQSHLDLACQLIFTPNIIFLTNEWVWKNPLYGLIIRHAEYYPVGDGIDVLLPKLRSLVARGYSIAVYPEGTRSTDCSIGRFHQGAFHIAECLDLDIIPMYLYGTGRVLPKKSHCLHKGPIHIEIGVPVTQEQLKSMGDTRRQASLMRKHYMDEYERIANRIEQGV